MSFPPCERVIYRRNPLKQVICQLRFPPILRIESELPAGFQERIRGSFPVLRESNPPIPGMAGLPDEIMKMIAPAIQPVGAHMTREFLTADDKWKVGLTRDFLALTCTEYLRWEDFKAHLRLPFDALVQEYAPAFCVRV